MYDTINYKMHHYLCTKKKKYWQTLTQLFTTLHFYFIFIERILSGWLRNFNHIAFIYKKKCKWNKLIFLKLHIQSPTLLNSCFKVIIICVVSCNIVRYAIKSMGGAAFFLKCSFIVSQTFYQAVTFVFGASWSYQKDHWGSYQKQLRPTLLSQMVLNGFLIKKARDCSHAPSHAHICAVTTTMPHVVWSTAILSCIPISEDW